MLATALRGELRTTVLLYNKTVVLVQGDLDGKKRRGVIGPPR
jgi:hypothetical protein